MEQHSETADKAGATQFVDPVEIDEGEADDGGIRRVWRMHREVANGAPWPSVLSELEKEASRQLEAETLQGSAVLIWEGDREFFHRVIWSDEDPDQQKGHHTGALASLLTREPALKVALCEQGQAALRCHGDEARDLLIPIGEGEFLGVYFLFGLCGAELEDATIWSMAHLFRPLITALIDRYLAKCRIRSVEEENRYFRERERRHYLFKDLVCESQVMRRVYDDLHERVDEKTPILMTGEAGTGKELLARALHHLGGRQEGMLIRMGCAGFPEELVDFELFGCVASELTGAVAARKGIFELAEGGTVFLDEIDRLSPMIQGKVARVLQEREVRRVGDAVGRPVNARLIASSHRDLDGLCKNGQFRRDLYDLLESHRLEVPPLRERKEDILPLARIFLKKFAERYDANCRVIGEELQRWIVEYRWPGNVRQLQTLMEAAVLMGRDDDVVERRHLTMDGVNGR